jgi:NAD(P)H-flavin reductase
VRASFDALGDNEDKATNYFYSCLFVAHPELRQMFPPAMDEQRDRLFRAIRKIVDTMSTPAELADYLAQLGRDHRKYGVTPQMYGALGEAFNQALRRYAGAVFTPAAEEAWTQAYLAASSIMIRAAESDPGPASVTGYVIEHSYRGNGIATMTVAPAGPLPYLAGQHVTIEHPRWPRVWRPYSIANRPRDDGMLTFHVRAVSGGWVSSSLVHYTSPGMQLTLGPALGGMTLGRAASRDLVCIAGGTGLSPVKAIVEQAVRDSLSRGEARSVHLYCGARHREELYDLEGLWKISDAYPGLIVTPVTSDDVLFEGMQGNVGRVAARYLPHGDCEVYVAGPEKMVRETIILLAAAGVPPDRVHYDDALLAGRERVGSGT